MDSVAAPTFRILVRMSTSALLLLTQGCVWHLGEPPAPAWQVAVVAPVTEPGVDDALDSALARVLSARGPAEPRRRATARVTTAAWEPLPLASDRDGSTTWRAVLVVDLDVQDGGGSVPFRAERVVVAHDAGTSVDARAAAFAVLAAEIAPAIAAHLRARG